MIDFKNSFVKILLFILLLIGSLGLIYVQIINAQMATRLELALINSMQFLLSIGFTWLLAGVVFENNQKEKQKRFAIAALRRIKEIERNIIRTYNYVCTSLRVKDDISACLRVIQSTLLNIQDTITSSIYDWADVIEDEIKVMREIEKLENKQNNLVEETNTSQSDQKKNEKLIQALSKKLPPVLRESLNFREEKAELTNKATTYLENEITRHGHIEFDAFWESKDDFMKKPSSLKKGDNIYIAQGFTTNRRGAILVYDKSGKSMGVVTNRCSPVNVDYEIFAAAMSNIFGKKLIPKLFGGKPISAQVSKIKSFSKEYNRQYFKLIVQKNEANIAAKNINIKEHSADYIHAN